MGEVPLLMNSISRTCSGTQYIVDLFLLNSIHPILNSTPLDVQWFGEAEAIRSESSWGSIDGYPLWHRHLLD